MTIKEIKDFAVKNGYDDAEYLKKWHRYDCYEPFWYGGVSYVGLPYVIMVKGKEMRFSTDEEALEICAT